MRLARVTEMGKPRICGGSGSASVPASGSLLGIILGVNLLPSLRLNNKVEGKLFSVAVDCLKADRSILEHTAQCKGG